MSIDGVVVPESEARVPVTDDGFLRGDGVFEVMRVYAGVPFAFDEHLQRLRGSAANLRLDLDLGVVEEEARALLASVPAQDALLRIVCTRGGLRLAMLEAVPQHLPVIRLAAVTFAPTRILDGVKSLSYAANMLAGRIAREGGADEALLVTPHGRVLEAPTSAFFYSTDGGTLATPPLADHILDSITRRHVIAVTGAVERSLALDDVRTLREAFLSSTIREVQPIASIDDAVLPEVPGPLTGAAAVAIRARIAEAVAQR